MIRIALDAMGGDFAPRETVLGGVLAVQDAEVLGMANHDLEIVLVGRKEDIEKELSQIGNYPKKAISIVDAREVVEMGESPAQACKQKRDSSVVRCAELVKKREVAATVSAGNSGATMAAALMMCGRLDGVMRPAIVTMVPSVQGVSVLVDAGANVDCKAKHLLQFALMGDVFARTVLNFKNPRVGLLSIGEEETKGNELVFEAQAFLKKVPLNYIGNVEGRDIVNGNCDVTVCDGFVGNVTLKAIEGVGELVYKLLKKEMSSNLFTLVGGLLAAPAFRRFKRSIDYKEYGGAPLLGIDGLSLISHGKSNAVAIKNAIRATLRCVNKDMNGFLKDQILKYGQVSDKPETKPGS
ncbi:MAG TPA: phosphate acyltransferase PlsX [bacterium]|nr:phosphate acyltransferase PlsX [bacterium]